MENNHTGRFIKFFWLFSMLFFMLILFFSYAYLRETSVGIHFNEYSQPDQFISRDIYFYIGLAVFIISNLIWYLFNTVINTFSKKAVNIQPASIFHRENVHRLIDWFNGFSFLSNVFFMVILILIGIMNNSADLRITHYGWMIYFSLGLLFVWVLVLGYLLIKPYKPELETI